MIRKYDIFRSGRKEKTSLSTTGSLFTFFFLRDSLNTTLSTLLVLGIDGELLYAYHSEFSTIF